MESADLEYQDPGQGGTAGASTAPSAEMRAQHGTASKARGLVRRGPDQRQVQAHPAARLSPRGPALLLEERASLDSVRQAASHMLKTGPGRSPLATR